MKLKVVVVEEICAMRSGERFVSEVEVCDIERLRKKLNEYVDKEYWWYEINGEYVVDLWSGCGNKRGKSELTSDLRRNLRERGCIVINCDEEVTLHVWRYL